MNPTREHLLGYVLGALEPPERELVERELEIDPVLASELHRVEDGLGRMGLTEAPEHFQAPAGLARRTCEFVSLQSTTFVTPASAAFSSTTGPAEIIDSRRFTWVDLLTAAAVLIAGFALFFPALSHSRFQAQIATCQNHMRQVGLALQEHAVLDTQRRFPQIAARGNRSRAGIYAPVLANNQLVLDPRSFFCPTGSFGTRPSDYESPTLEELDAATGDRLAHLWAVMGGDFGYNMGYYTQDGQLVAPRDERRANYPLLADKPSDVRPGRTTAHHWGRGQNIQCEDGSVRFCPTESFATRPTAELLDDPFHNLRGEVAAGLHPQDAVLGASSDSPLPIQLISEGR